MFTGLVEAVEPIKTNVATATGRRLVVPLGRLADGAGLGESICVNGVCLTISQLRSSEAVFDIMAETVKVSTLAQLHSGEAVNLERAMAADGRFGGHIVHGHVDGVGTVEKIDQSGAQWVMWITANPALLRMMIGKGSVAIDGVSLTIVEARPDKFSVSLIPTTLEQTNLKQRKVSDRVNLEVDIISKWITKRLDEMLSGGKKEGITLKKLREQGFS
ncbi:MAG: riboflavin synthase [Sedimentisphaerales bacterium]|nr:riboflavin synthase [Sedimentisphaerales bacterium]